MKIEENIISTTKGKYIYMYIMNASDNPIRQNVFFEQKPTKKKLFHFNLNIFSDKQIYINKCF